MATAHLDIVELLATLMHACRESPYDISFDACLSEARKQFQREVREEALNPATTTK